MSKRSVRLYSWSMLLLALGFALSLSGCEDKGIVLEIKANQSGIKNGMFLVSEPLFFDSQGNRLDFTEEQKAKIKYKIDMGGRGFAGLIKNAQYTFDAYNAINIAVATGPTFTDWPTLGAIKLLTDVSIPTPTPGDCVVGMMKSLQSTSQIVTQGLLMRRLIPIGWEDKLEIFYPANLFGNDPSKITVMYVFQDYEMINNAEVTATNVPGPGTLGPGPLKDVLKTVMKQCGGGILTSGLLDDDFRYSFFSDLISNCQARVNPPYNEILRSSTCEGSEVTMITPNKNGVTQVDIELIDCFGEKKGSIRGRVTDASNGSPILNARVITDPSTSTITTDASGNYTISDVTPGTYTVTATKDGYNDNRLDIAVAPGGTATVNMSLSGSGSITGGLVVYYPFNGNANDESGHDLHGVVHGVTLTTDRFGNQNKAYSFSGRDNYIEVPDDDLLGIDDAITIMLWAKIDPTSTEGFLISKRVEGTDDINYDIKYGVNSDGSRVMCFQYGRGSRTGNNYCQVDAPNFNDGRWHHVAVSLVFGTPSSAKWLFDGRLINGRWTHWDGSAYGGTDKPSANTNKLQIGRQLSTSPGYFKGALSEIRIYDRGLSVAEIGEIFKK